MNTGREFLGKGWHFPVETDENGQIKMARYEDAVRQSLEIIIGTALRERVMRPDFGCGIHELVFALNSAETSGLIISEVQRAITLWEPRVDLIGVTTEFSASEPNKVIIRADYTLRADNSRFNLVYPFYLE